MSRKRVATTQREVYDGEKWQPTSVVDIAGLCDDCGAPAGVVILGAGQDTIRWCDNCLLDEGTAMIYCPDCDVPCTSEHLPGCRQVTRATDPDYELVGGLTSEREPDPASMGLWADCCDDLPVPMTPDGRCVYCDKRSGGPFYGGTAEERERAGMGRSVLDGVKRATTCSDSLTDRNDEHRTYECRLPEGHQDPHRDGDAEWTSKAAWYDGDWHGVKRKTEEG